MPPQTKMESPTKIEALSGQSKKLARALLAGLQELGLDRHLGNEGRAEHDAAWLASFVDGWFMREGESRPPVEGVRDELPNPSLTVVPQEWQDAVLDAQGEVSQAEVLDVAHAVANSAQKRGDGKFSGGDAKKWYAFLVDVAMTIERLASQPDTGEPVPPTPADGSLRVMVSRVPNRLAYNVGAVVEVAGRHHINNNSPASMGAFQTAVEDVIHKHAGAIAEQAVQMIEEESSAG